MTLEPNRDQLEIFVQSVFRHCNTDDTNGKRVGIVNLRAFFEGDSSKSFRITPVPLVGGLRFLMDAAEDDARRAANFPKAVVFCPPVATFLASANGHAREEDLLEAPVLSVELDRNPRTALAALQRILGPATLVIRSGGFWTNPETGEVEDKLHGYWRLKEPAHGADIAKLKKARRLATALVGGDPSNVPACHPIRWPGSWHRKAEPRLCEIVESDPDREINLDDALAKLEAVAPRVENNNAAASNDGQGRDWNDDFGKIITGAEFHPTLAPLASSLARHGIPEAATLQMLRALLSNTQTTDPERIARRDTEFSKLKDTVRSGYAKFATATTTPARVFDPWARCIVPAFPFEILPPVVRKFVGAEAAVIGCDPSVMAMCTLGAFSGALHHGMRLKMLRNGSWHASPRLWILYIGPASSKKTPTFNAVTRPLVDHEAHLRAEYQITLHEYKKAKEEGGTKNDPPAPPLRYLTWDWSVEKLGEMLTRGDGRKGILVPADELSGWLGSMERYSNSRGRSERAFWLKAYDGGPYGFDRIDRGEIYVPNLSASILGGIQPERLAELHGLTSDGLLQRFVPVIGAEPTFRLDRASHHQAYDNLVRRMIFTKPGSLIMTDDALAVMEGLHRHLFDLGITAQGLDAGFQAFVGKLDGVAGSLALILHMAKHLANNPQDAGSGIADPVDVSTVKNVRRLMLDFILPHAREFYYGAGTTSGERLQRLASWVLTCGKDRIIASDITSNIADCRGLTLRDVNERVSPLVACGWLYPADSTPACRAWSVNPQVRVQLAERARMEESQKAILAQLMGSPKRGSQCFQITRRNARCT